MVPEESCFTIQKKLQSILYISNCGPDCYFFDDAHSLFRVITQDWVREWTGWQISATMLNNEKDEWTQRLHADEWATRFAHFICDHIVIDVKRDEIRVAELKAAGHDVQECIFY